MIKYWLRDTTEEMDQFFNDRGLSTNINLHNLKFIIKTHEYDENIDLLSIAQKNFKNSLMVV